MSGNGGKADLGAAGPLFPKTIRLDYGMPGGTKDGKR